MESAYSATSMTSWAHRDLDMAFRIRKSFKIAPGIRLNVSKSGLSTSLGRKGATVNISKRGTKVTTGIPGLGISRSKLYKPAAGGAEVTYPLWTRILSGLVAAVVLLWIFN